MTTIGINTLVYMTELANGTPQSNLLPIIASHGITLAEVRREYIASDAEFDLIAAAPRPTGSTCSTPYPNRSPSTAR